MKKVSAIVFAVFMTVSLSFAQETWVKDQAHSEVSFSISHMVVAEVTGEFKEFDVTLKQATKEDFTGSSLVATIKTASIDTDNEGRDKHLRSDDFFNAEKFPTITFKSTSIEKTGSNTYSITGVLTIRDVTRPVVLKATYAGEVKDQRGNLRRGFKATTSVNRFDYGLKWDKAVETGGLVAGDVVDITLRMEMVLSK